MDLTISKNMDRALKDIYLSNSINGINKSTLNALVRKEMLTSEYELTNNGKAYAISKKPLKNQCLDLNIDYQEIIIDYIGKPEPVVLEYFKSQGYLGATCEGNSIFNVLKAFMLDAIIKNSIHTEENKLKYACMTFLEAQLYNNDRKDELINSINFTSKEQFIKNFKMIISNNFIQKTCPDLSLEFAILMFDAIDRDTYIKLATKIAEDSYLYRNGWPDLTLVKDNIVEFIEVKAKDKLHESQLITIPVMKDILPFKFGVCRIKRK
ncbi:VRR-NUC domain-containing protein [bacterium]|nr:VRR-NUC domain-containing protein [bacterium]MBU1990977.1 VRR-NUC domain-containing protein [bacterium]